MDSVTHPIALLGYTAIISYTFNLTLWATAALAFCLLNAKALPLMYHIRILPSLLRLYFPTHPLWRTPPSHHSPLAHHPPTTLPSPLFRPHTTRTRACALECDINLHKSNSTFFTDMDASRAALLSSLFAAALHQPSALLLSPSSAPSHQAHLILAATSADFLRPIPPYQPYEVRSRLLAWDKAKWIYVQTLFVRPGGDEKVFATAVSRYVCKAGRETVKPERLVEVAGLGGGDEEEERLRGLEEVGRVFA